MTPGSRLSLGSWDGTRWVKARAILLGLVLCGGLALVLGRAFHLQVLEQDWLAGMAREQYLRTAELAPRRGEILDRNGGKLASSVEVESIFVDPKFLGADDAEKRANLVRIARAAGLAPKAERKLLERALAPGNRFAWVKRKASPATVAAVEKLGLGKGVSTVKEPRRFYPQKELAAQLLGFVGADGRGLEGLERALDEELRGQAAALPALRDARGRRLLPDVSVPVEERTGATVELTLDRNLQYLTEKALEKGVEQARAKAGTAVVLDPRTGEILAMAHAPAFNPNVIPGPGQRDAVRPRAVSDAFEPGSTMKVFLLAGALEHGKIKPRQSFDCEKGRWKVGRHTIHDHRHHEWLTPGEILQYSSNVCSGKVGLLLGGEGLAQVYRDFGFGARTGVPLPAESPGLVAPMKSEISVVTASFGQGPVMVSALQLANAMAAVANGGELLEPWLVRSVTAPDGTVLHRGERKVVRRVISPATAAKVTEWMELVVSEGTAQRAQVPGYRVAGKTGTAQKVDPVRGGYGKARIASFGGFVPAEDPRLAMVVVIDEPETNVYGGVVAAPVFREIAEGALKALGVPPTLPLVAKKEEAPKKRPATKVAEPAAEGLITVADEAPLESPDLVRVPRLEGLFARAAVRELAAARLEADLQGSGRVVKQEPPAGSIVDRGSRVAVTLQPL